MTAHDPNFEEQLRRALRPVDPPAGFAERVLVAIERRRTEGAQMPVESSARSGGATSRRPWLGRRDWISAAATLVLAVLAGAGWTWHQHSRGLRAHAAQEQVLQALRISSEALNAALAVATHPIPPGDS